ncbi:hypothetical protein EBR43_10270 [bacterium]|nr:hypothetical protein [bacterium]
MSAAIPIIRETLNTASSDPTGASMRNMQVFKRSLSTSTDSGSIIKSAVGVSSTTRSTGSYPTDNNASFVVNAQNTEDNRITEVVRGNILTKGQNGLNSLSSAMSQSIGNRLFATTPDADIIIKAPVLNQSVANGIQTTLGIDKVTSGKMADSSFSANSVTVVNVGTSQISNTIVGSGQKLSILLNSGKINSISDNLDASNVHERIRQVQESRSLSVFSTADLNNLKQVQNFLLPGSRENGGIAQALSQNIDLVLNTINTNSNSNRSAILTNLRTNLVNPLVTSVLAVIATDAVNGILPLSTHTSLKTSIFAVYFGAKVYGNFSSTGPNENGYGATSNLYYGAAPIFFVSNDVLNSTGQQESIWDYAYNAVVNGGGD